jgi:hypothetical protein
VRCQSVSRRSRDGLELGDAWLGGMEQADRGEQEEHERAGVG